MLCNFQLLLKFYIRLTFIINRVLVLGRTDTQQKLIAPVLGLPAC